MSTRNEWINERVAPTPEAMRNGDGNHKDECKSLREYLEGRLAPSEAAIAITTPVLQDPDPPSVLYRLHGLLCEALVNLSDDRERLIDLIASIQELPPTARITWRELPGFHAMWFDSFFLYSHGLSGWERLDESRKESEAGVRKEVEASAAAEARLFVRGVANMSPVWGYKRLDMIGWERPGLGVFISGMYIWLVIGGKKLVQDLELDKVEIYRRVEATMAEHWERWKKGFKEATEKEELLSAEERSLAAECHRLMEELR